MAATRREDGFGRMAYALAEGGFCGPASPEGDDEDVHPAAGRRCVHREAHRRLDAALDAIEDELIGQDDEA